MYISHHQRHSFDFNFLLSIRPQHFDSQTDVQHSYTYTVFILSFNILVSRNPEFMSFFRTFYWSTTIIYIYIYPIIKGIVLISTFYSLSDLNTLAVRLMFNSLLPMLYLYFHSIYLFHVIPSSCLSSGPFTGPRQIYRALFTDQSHRWKIRINISERKPEVGFTHFQILRALCGMQTASFTFRTRVTEYTAHDDTWRGSLLNFPKQTYFHFLYSLFHE